MLNIHQDIRSLTDFKRHTASFMKQLKGRHRPIVLTVNGKAELIIQDAESYQTLLEMADRFEAIAALQDGIAQSQRGEGVPLHAFDLRMRKKYGIPR